MRLVSLDDIRKLIHRADVKLHVAPDAVKWLQMRACTLGAGGLGRALACFYLACKLAFVQNADAITAQHLEDVADLTMGDEDAQRVAEVVGSGSRLGRPHRRVSEGWFDRIRKAFDRRPLTCRTAFLTGSVGLTGDAPACRVFQRPGECMGRSSYVRRAG